MLQKACTCYVFKEQYVTTSVHCYLMKQERQALPSCTSQKWYGAQVNMWCCIMDGFDREIVATIQHVQSQVNSFIKMFLQAGKNIRNPDVLNIWLVIHEGAGVDLQTRNRPMCNKVATILLDDNIRAKWDIILHQRGRGWQRISYTHLAYDPLHFPLLLPNGKLGWHVAVCYQGDATSHKTIVIHNISLSHTDSTSRPMRTHCCFALQADFCVRFPN